jgi:LmbE family N-acetylglucosaminyl deacetylase
MCKNILCLAPHTDDEILCAGTLAKYKFSGAKIKIVAFSFPNEIPQIKVEFENSCKVLDATFELHNFPIRNFSSVRQDILEIMVKLNAEKHYDLVFCPCSTDTHQDHEVIRNECFRAFKQTTTIYGYQASHNCIDLNSHIYSIIQSNNIVDKLKMIECYKSQGRRYYFQDNYFDMLARVSGMAVKETYAEIFENIRTIIR